MTKYKALDEPITRREACLILDRKSFDGMVRSGKLRPLGKRGDAGTAIEMPDAKQTAPLLFDQAAVREAAKELADEHGRMAAILRADAKALNRKDTRPLTRRQIATLIGGFLTGVLIRSGKLVPSGKLTDTQTAAHTFDPGHVRDVLLALAEERTADARLLTQSTRTRVPK